MNSRPNDHPALEALRAFVSGELEESAEDVISDHVNECQTCLETLDRLGLGATPHPASIEGIESAEVVHQQSLYLFAENLFAEAGLSTLTDLQELSDPAPLKEALQNDDWRARLAAAWTIGVKKMPGCEAALTKTTKDENQHVRTVAVEALSQLPGHAPPVYTLSQLAEGIQRLVSKCLDSVQEALFPEELVTPMGTRPVSRNTGRLAFRSPVDPLGGDSTAGDGAADWKKVGRGRYTRNSPVMKGQQFSIPFPLPADCGEHYMRTVEIVNGDKPWCAMYILAESHCGKGSILWEAPPYSGTMQVTFLASQTPFEETEAYPDGTCRPEIAYDAVKEAMADNVIMWTVIVQVEP